MELISDLKTSEPRDGIVLQDDSTTNIDKIHTGKP